MGVLSVVESEDVAHIRSEVNLYHVCGPTAFHRAAEIIKFAIRVVEVGTKCKLDIELRISRYKFRGSKTKSHIKGITPRKLINYESKSDLPISPFESKARILAGLRIDVVGICVSCLLRKHEIQIVEYNIYILFRIPSVLGICVFAKL